MTEPSTALKAFQSSIEKARDGRQMLSILTEHPNAKSLVPELSVDDLYVCLQMIGVEDSETVLALATGQQVQGLLDLDGWQRDVLLPERVSPWLQSLMRAGPEVLTRRLLDLDDALLMYLVTHHVDAIIVEDPDDFVAPEQMHVFTPDNQTCLVFKTDTDENLPVRIFLDTLMRFDAAHCLNLLAHLNATLPSNLEEESYRWRSARMADRGYVEYYEALRIYSPLPHGYQHNRPSFGDGFNAGLKTKAIMLRDKALNTLSSAVSALNEQDLERFHCETALASNMAMSADRVELWDSEGQLEVLQRIRNGIELGLILHSPRQASASQLGDVLLKHGAIALFRHGYQAAKDAIGPAKLALDKHKFRSPAGALGAVDLPLYETWAQRLTGRHPHLGDGVFPHTLEGLELMRLWGNRLVQLTIAATNRPLECGVVCWIWTLFLSQELGGDQILNHRTLNSLLPRTNERDGLHKNFVTWFNLRVHEADEQLVELIFETCFDEMLALARQDLPLDTSLQFVYFAD